MDTIISTGIEVSLFFQDIGNTLIEIMKFFSFLGSEDFYLLIMPILVWSIDYTLGMRMGVMLLVSSLTNLFFKFSEMNCKAISF